MKKKDLVKIQSEATRIATGATKLVSLSTLSNEICWETPEQLEDGKILDLLYFIKLQFYPTLLVQSSA